MFVFRSVLGLVACCYSIINALESYSVLVWVIWVTKINMKNF